VFWYKATDKGYNLQSNPGPNIPGGAEVHQGIIMSAGIAQYSGNATDGFFCGNALDDTQGRCGVIWSKDLCERMGTCTSAKFRGELRDGWSDDAFCNAGPMAIRCGVADFSGNVGIWGDPGLVAENATWQDFLNPLGSGMGYDMTHPVLEAEDTIEFTAPAGRQGEAEPSVLDKQFVEIDITGQVNWILSHTGANMGSYSGQYAIVFLSTPGMGSTGKINCYADEAFSGSQTAMGSDAPWTTDGNTVHILVEGTLEPIAVEQGVKTALSTLSLSQNVPNPFTASSAIAYNTGKDNGMLKIYAPSGQVVFSQEVTGNGTMNWNSGKLASGIYVYRLTVGSKVLSKRMILMR
jgi:hypothetical protein